ncbi:MAG: hypothetical protein IJS26_03105 [Alphaproteobacteria bacterium]|nr:hypothetical protein [Alphaproteobacteria bacterium]
MEQIINWNYQRSAFAPEAHKKNVKILIQAAVDAFEKDIDEQDVLEVDELRRADNFLAFCEANKTALESLGRFFKDFQGAHDKDRYLYQWPQIQEFTFAVFKFGVAFDGRVRLLDITGWKLGAFLALDDEEVCRYILAHFGDYFQTKRDMHDVQRKLYDIWNKRYVKVGSVPWCLYELCRRYFERMSFE